MNSLELAVIHDAKNNLGEVIFRLEARGDCFVEIETLVRTSNSLTNLILWHRQQDGEMRVNVDSASPADLLNEMVVEFRQFFPNLTIECDVNDAPIFWFYDETYVRLALVNALHNACRFAKNRVQLSVAEISGQLMFRVCDDGEGYSDAMLERHQKQQLEHVSQKGTGMGLALASAIAAMHANKEVHGAVVLRNDHGAVFELRLP